MISENKHSGTCMHTFINIRVCVCIYIYTRINSTYVYIYIYIHTYIHRYMHAYKESFSMQDRPAAQTVPGKKQSAPARAPINSIQNNWLHGVSLGI